MSLRVTFLIMFVPADGCIRGNGETGLPEYIMGMKNIFTQTNKEVGRVASEK